MPYVVVTVAGRPVFERCIFRNNNGQAIFSDFSQLHLSNCLFHGNSTLNGPTIGLHGGEPAIRNCTITGNQAAAANGAIHCSLEPLVTITSTILWNNQPREISIEPGEPPHVSVSFSAVTGGYPGLANIDADPLFVDPAGADFRLQSGSPCVDTGDPDFATGGAVDLAGRRRAWDGDSDGTAVVDMGAYEAGSFRYGDCNCDDAINFGDIDPFVLALADAPAYLAEFPTCHPLLADANGDGVLGFDDINAFVSLLSGM